MQRLLTQISDIQQHIRSNWKEYSILTFDRLKEQTIGTILWPSDKIQYNKIWNWFKNEKKRIKNSAENATSIIDKTERAQKIFVKEEGNILQALAKLKTLDARIDFLKEQLERNFLVMLDLMKAIQLSPYDTFLEELFDLCSELENSHSQVLLFIRICALYADESMDVDQELIKRTLIELSNETIDSHAAYGLLKLAYGNELSFDQLPINTLLAFEKQYILEIQAFIRSLHGRIDFQIAQSLPDTCLIFTQPFFKMLLNRGKLLHEGIQPCYLIHVVELVAYSFVTQYSLVEDFVAQFKAGCISIYGRGFDLQPLLQRVIEEEIAQNGLYFGSLSNQIKLFQQVFHLIRENRIAKQIDTQMIDELVSLNQEVYKSKIRQHKNMGPVDMEQNFAKYCKLFQKENQSQELILKPVEDISTMMKAIFQCFNIPALNLMQMASLAVMEQQQKAFQVFGTGTGKTTLALAYIVKLAKMDGVKCFYINDVPELCARDFKRIIDVTQKMDIKSIMIDNEGQLQTINSNQIIFLSSSIFYKLYQQEEFKHTLNEAVLVLDEFDLLFFAQEINQQKLISFTLSKRLVAFTGSPLEKYHKNVISHYFNVIPLNYPAFDKISGTSNICLFQEIFSTRKLQLNKLTEFCCTQIGKTPVLIVMEQEAIKQFQILCKKQNVHITDFNEMNYNQIMAFLDSTFTQKINDHYSICILNSSQGRGLDVPSSADIENAGGVATVIAQLPISAQEYTQFKGRTNRMGNKGQHCIILWARTNLPAQLFINYHFETTHNKEIIRLNQLFQNKDFIAISDQVQKQDNADFPVNQQQSEMKQILIIDDDSLKVQIERSKLKSFEQEEMKTKQEVLLMPENITKKKVQPINDDLNKMTEKANEDQHAQSVERNLDKKKVLGKRNTDEKAKDETVSNKRQKLK